MSWARLGDPQVGHHGVGFPPSDELDDISVDTSAEQGGGATRVEPACSEVHGVEASDCLETSGGVLEVGADVVRGDVVVGQIWVQPKI
jgi:hypothetical protein